MKTLKWNRWYVFPIVAVLALTQWACGEDGFGSTQGAGGNVEVNGTGNNVCVVTADATDDNENITDNCLTILPAPDPESPDTGTSQLEDTPE